jgi:TolB-like protein/DNA-binding winged helix-turn-helix (wHTH) protein
MPVVYKFGDFCLDCGRYELLRGDRPVKLERKPLDLLVLFTSRQGQLVTRTEIAAKLWASDVFVDTEHGINTAIRKLRVELRDDPAKPRFIQTVTGLGYRFVAPVITEAAPDAAQVELDPPAAVTPIAPPKPSDARRSSRLWIWWIAAAAGICGVVFFLIARRHPSTPPAIASLAVLPLENLSGNSDQEYLADGMTDELTTMLARNSNLRIPSRTSVMQYKGARQPLTAIAQSLQVDAVVEGSIARKGSSEGGRVHLTLQLIRADNDSHVWAQSYDRSAGDSMLAEAAARDIAKQLQAGRSNQVAVRNVSPAAHDAYLHGRYLWFGQDMEKSGEFFREATRLQPDYADAWAGLSDYYGEGVAAGLLDPRTSLGPMEEAAQRALSLDPDLAQAHQAMAATYLIAKWDWANADRESQLAIQLDPNDAELYYLRACVLGVMKRYPEAIEAARHSMELAPMQRPGGLAGILMEARQYDAALDDLRLRREALANDFDLLYVTSDTLRRKGNYAEAADFYEKWLAQLGDDTSADRLRLAWRQGGEPAFARERIGGFKKWAKVHYASPVDQAGNYAQLRDKDTTLTLLEEGYRQRSTGMLWIEDDPAFDFLRAEPRYRALVQEIGRPKGE